MTEKSNRRTGNVRPLTEDRILKQKPPSAGRTYLYDAHTPGLAVCVTSSGTKTFYFAKRLNGRFVRTPIARVGEISLGTAREAVVCMLADHVVKGVDPAETKRRRIEKTATLGMLWGHYLETHAKPRKRTWRQDQLRYDKHLAKWKERTLTEIDLEDVASLHRSIGAKAPYEANRTLALLRTMFSKAGKLFRGQNPCAGVEKFPEQSREVFVHADQMPAFFAGLGKLRKTSPICADALEMCIWTAARSGNVKSMRWEEINLERAVWIIPGAKHKNGRPVTVPLVPQAVAILERRQAETNGPFVFPGRRQGQPLKHLQRPWGDLCKAAGLQGVRMHDLRRTAGSWMAAGGTSLHIVGKALGHRTAAATAIYARLDLDPVRQAVSAAAAAIEAAATATVKK